MKIGVPDDHRPLVAHPGGTNCASCRFADEESHSCSSPDYAASEIVQIGSWKKPKGSGALPPDEKLEDLCSDWWEGSDAGSATDRLKSAITARKKR